jgi:Chitobiase/beta-hexosaminidase C-terminal domain
MRYLKNKRSFSSLSFASLVFLYFSVNATLFAQSIDFENDPYIAGKTVVGIDGWNRVVAPSSIATDNFVIQSASGNKWLQAALPASIPLRRIFQERVGKLNLSWRWRPNADDIQFCLGVSGNLGGGALGNRASVCMDSEGIFIGEGLKSSSSSEKWAKETWYYMRILINPESNEFNIFLSLDSLRANEREILSQATMNGVGALTTLKLWGEKGNGTVDIDDISWESQASWNGESDSTWSNSKNWSSGEVPDSLTHVIFEEGSRKCFVDKHALIKSISVLSTWSRTLNLGKSSLTVLGNANFSGGTIVSQTTGGIRFLSPRGQRLVGPDGGRKIPTIRHEGTGTLRLDTRPLYVTSLSQTQGRLDFNGQDLKTSEDFIIKNGQPNTLQGLDGRTIVVGKLARFEGRSLDTLLGLGSREVLGLTPKGWNITANNTDSLITRFTSIDHSNVNGTKGYAYQSKDGGNNSGWIFVSPPTIISGPKDQNLKPGENALFKITVNSQLQVTYQWLRNGQEISTAKDSVYSPGIVKLADNGATFSCRVTSLGGTTLSTAALVQVNFPAPIPTPGPKEFTDVLIVNLTPTVDGAKTFFSKNGGTYSEALGSIALTETTHLTAFSVFAGDTSAVGTWTYPKNQDTTGTLSRPTASPEGSFFADSQTIVLNAPTTAADAALYYLFGSSNLTKYAGPFTIRESGILKIIASKGAKISDTTFYTFTHQLEAPSASPKSRSFSDTLLISLTTKIPGATIRYTWDGTEPSLTSRPYLGTPLLLDSSAVLKAIAIKGMDISGILSETYKLIPTVPRSSYSSGDYSSKIQINLTTSASHALIYYTLDGSVPGPENGSLPYSGPFWLETTSTLKAIAISGYGLGMQRSPILTEYFNFINPGQAILKPGEKLNISSNYSLTSILSGASPINVDILRADSLAKLKGFRDIQFAIRLSLPNGSQAFPNILFTAPNGEDRALYSLEPSGLITYITDADAFEILQAGTYFLGIDTLPPQIFLSGESFGTDDSTKVVLTIQDNISNLVFNLERTDNAKKNVVNRSIGSPEIITTFFRNPPGSIQPLSFRALVDDHRQKATFPAQASTFHNLAQKNSSPVRTPALFKIGTRVGNLWDLIALPLAVSPPITLAQLRQNNAIPGLVAALWDPILNAYRYFKDNEAMNPGTAIWMAAPSSLMSMAFPSLKTLPRSETGAYKLTLHKGWNQVANPTLTPLYWPVTRTVPETYNQSALKGLHGYDAATDGYIHADVLLPWRGYFAFYKGGRDTTIELSYQPISAPKTPAAVSKSGVPDGLSVNLNVANLPTLRLGASVRSLDGLGLEDESRPPSQNNNSTSFWSLREKARLETDFMHWVPGKLYIWQIVAESPGTIKSNRTLESNLSDSNHISSMVSTTLLPDGYSAWAVSKTRGIRFPLVEGASIPMYPGVIDSMIIMAGPTAEIESRLASVPMKVEALKIRFSVDSRNLVLNLSLPQAAHVEWKIWTLEGRIRESGSLNLAEGIYHLTPNLSSPGLRSGMYVLQLVWTGRGGREPDKNGSLKQKFAIP